MHPNFTATEGTLEEYQKYIKQVCKARGWDKRTALEKMLFLTEEVGELAKEIRKHAGIYGYPEPANSNELAGELVDVLNYVLDIANMYDISLADAFQEKWQHNATRTWN